MSVHKSQTVSDTNAAVDSVSNADGTLTISPTTGAVVASRAGITGPIAVAAGGNTSTVTAQTGTGTTFAMNAVPSFSTTIGVGGATASASGSGISFPATQSSSSDVNTLDDYEEGTWTPTYGYQTTGDLSVVYSTQIGIYTKIGNQVNISAVTVTSTHTYTTASGNQRISGFPFTSQNTATQSWITPLQFQGIVQATYTNFTTQIDSNKTFCTTVACGTAVSLTAVSTTGCASGTQQTRYITATYQTAT